MKTYTAKKIMTDAEATALGGLFINDTHYSLLLDKEDAAVYREDGSPLLMLKKRCVREHDAQAALKSLFKAAKLQDNRGMAAGKFNNHGENIANVDGVDIGIKTETRYKGILPNGAVSKTSRSIPVPSGIVGAFDRNPRFPYCRLTAFSNEHADKMRAALPFIQTVNNVFRDHLPDRYAAQAAECARTHPDYIFADTVFSTVTVNRNWRTAVHKDAGDLKSGFGVLSVLSEGRFTGGYFVLPQYGIAANISHGDVILADVHEWHGNTELVGVSKYWTRLSTVFYFRAKMVGCKSIAQELETAKRRQQGQSLYADFDGEFPN